LESIEYLNSLAKVIHFFETAKQIDSFFCFLLIFSIKSLLYNMFLSEKQSFWGTDYTDFLILLQLFKKACGVCLRVIRA